MWVAVGGAQAICSCETRQCLLPGRPLRLPWAGWALKPSVLNAGLSLLPLAVTARGGMTPTAVLLSPSSPLPYSARAVFPSAPLQSLPSEMPVASMPVLASMGDWAALDVACALRGCDRREGCEQPPLQRGGLRLGMELRGSGCAGRRWKGLVCRCCDLPLAAPMVEEGAVGALCWGDSLQVRFGGYSCGISPALLLRGARAGDQGRA